MQYKSMGLISQHGMDFYFPIILLVIFQKVHKSHERETYDFLNQYCYFVRPLHFRIVLVNVFSNIIISLHQMCSMCYASKHRAHYQTLSTRMPSMLKLVRALIILCVRVIHRITKEWWSYLVRLYPGCHSLIGHNPSQAWCLTCFL